MPDSEHPEPHNPQTHTGANHGYVKNPEYLPNTAPILNSPPVVIYLINKPYLDFTCAIIVSCIVFCLWGGLFALFAFIMAMIGRSSAEKGDIDSARRLLIASYILSAIGLVAGMITIISLSVSLARQNGL